jgi:sterol desaturase/sphingolipid hydroxylase (fatty acid hydroxylase superfamily)
MIYLIPFILYWGSCLLLNSLNIEVNDNKLVKLNIVDKKTVFFNVLGGTIMHTIINFNLYYFNILDLIKLRYQYILYGIILVDTIEYFMHRALHKYKFLYKFHKVHHELNNPYNFGALYNSTIEGIIEVSLLLSGFILCDFSFNEYIIVISLANIATILDHSYFNYKKYFHYLHHSKYQNYNFQQPFFTYWDKLFKTYKI